MTGITYRREVDGLRAIAVLSVVPYHAGIAPRAGFVGVDIFFVISGYLITALLLREHISTGRIDLLAFYARRVRRIFPAALVVILAVLGMAGLLLPPVALTRTADSAGAAVVFVANIFFQAVTGGYFDSRAEEMPLLHLWSLSVEEQFYLLWPTLLILLLRWRPALFLKMLVGLAIASFVLAEWLIHFNPEAAFYQMPARFWELAAGGMIAALPARGAAQPWVATGASACILVACFVPLSHFPGAGALPVVLATAALLWAVHQGGELGIAGRLLRSSPMVGVGLISYSLYLWHWPLLAFYRAGSIGQGSTLMRLILCVAAALLAIASYRYIEQPFRRTQWPKGRLLAGGATLSLVVALSACAYGYKVQTNEAAKPTDNPLAVKAENDIPPGWQHCHYQVWSDGPLRAGCETIPGQSARIVLWGDSMAMAWQPLVVTLGQQAKQSSIDYSRDACGPFLGYLPSDPLPGYIKCRNWNARVLEYAKRADTVILVGRWAYDFTDNVSARLTALHATLAALSAVPHVVILGPTPEMRDLVSRCIRASNVDACAISRTQFDTDTTPILADLRAAAAGISNVHVVDMTDFFCTTTTCPAMKDGYALYWDSHHVSYTAAMAYARRYTANEVKSK